MKGNALAQGKPKQTGELNQAAKGQNSQYPGAGTEIGPGQLKQGHCLGTPERAKVAMRRL
jgi:hypothetical protein